MSDNHDVVPDGYNIGRYAPGSHFFPCFSADQLYRDTLVAGAIGKMEYGGVRYETQMENVTGRASRRKCVRPRKQRNEYHSRMPIQKPN